MFLKTSFIRVCIICTLFFSTLSFAAERLENLESRSLYYKDGTVISLKKLIQKIYGGARSLYGEHPHFTGEESEVHLLNFMGKVQKNVSDYKILSSCEVFEKKQMPYLAVLKTHYNQKKSSSFLREFGTANYRVYLVVDHQVYVLLNPSTVLVESLDYLKKLERSASGIFKANFFYVGLNNLSLAKFSRCNKNLKQSETQED
jgi:hypothetical protein